jgi:tRNA (cytosine38-C5)-methyltransferase
LNSLKYLVCEFLLSPIQFGVPNSRLRYYLLARLSPSSQPSGANGNPIRTELPSCDPAEHIPQSCAVERLSHYVDDSLRPESHPEVIIPNKVLERWGKLFDIVLPSQRRSCCFTRGAEPFSARLPMNCGLISAGLGYTHLVEGSGSILQMNETLEVYKLAAHSIPFANL